MSINDETLKKIAHLSRLEFSSEELDRMKRDFSRMLDFVEQLRQVDTTGISPLVSMTKEVNQFRPDQVKQELTQDQTFGNAPEHDGFHFKVPKVLPS